MKLAKLADYLREDIQLEDLYKIYKDEEEPIPLEKRVSQLLYELTLLPSYKGYKYLKEAILMLCDEDIYYESFSKSIYPEIAKRHNSTSQNIEKNIRFAIKKIYESNTPEEIERCLGLPPHTGSRPSNVKFISYCAEKLRLER